MRLATTRNRLLRPSALCLICMFLTSLLPALANSATLRPGDFVMVTRSGDVTPCCRVFTLDATSLAASEVASGGYVADPVDIAVNGVGDILVTTPASGVVRIDPASGGQTIFASLSSLGGGTPAGILVSAGDIYVTMRAVSPRVLQLNPDGSVARVVSSGGLLLDPAGLALGPDGALYVCDTYPLGGASGGGLMRVDIASGAQTLIASGAPLLGPFALAFGSDGWLWSTQRGVLGSRRAACVVRTRISDGYSETVAFGGCRTNGIAIRPDGLTAIADCEPISGDCYYSYTQIYPTGPSASDLSGPIAVIPDFATPATRTTWGRLKLIYR